MTNDATKAASREVAQSFADRALEGGWAIHSRITALFEECAALARQEAVDNLDAANSLAAELTEAQKRGRELEDEIETIVKREVETVETGFLLQDRVRMLEGLLRPFANRVYYNDGSVRINRGHCSDADYLAAYNALGEPS